MPHSLYLVVFILACMSALAAIYKVLNEEGFSYATQQFHSVLSVVNRSRLAHNSNHPTTLVCFGVSLCEGIIVWIILRYKYCCCKEIKDLQVMRPSLVV